MKVIAILEFDAKGNIVLQEFDVSDLPFFSRNSAKEIIRGTAAVLLEKMPNDGQEREILDESVGGKIFLWKPDIGLAVITDREYPSIQARRVLHCAAHTSDFATLLHDSQDKNKFDKLAKVQSELDAVYSITLDNVNKLLDRGQTLEQLLEKSKHLSAASQQFLKQAKKANSCCRYW